MLQALNARVDALVAQRQEAARPVSCLMDGWCRSSHTQLR